MYNVEDIKEIIKKAYEAPLSVTDETAKEVVSIERDYFYGDKHNNQRLSRIRTLLNDNFKKYKKEQVDNNEAP